MVPNRAMHHMLERQIEEEFLNKLYALDTQDEYYNAKKICLKFKKKKGTGYCFFHQKAKTKKSIKKFNKRFGPKTTG